MRAYIHCFVAILAAAKLCNTETHFLEHYEKKLNTLHMRMNGGKPLIINGKLKRFKCVEEYVEVDDEGNPIEKDSTKSHQPIELPQMTVTPAPPPSHSSRVGGVKIYRTSIGTPLPLSGIPSTIQLETSRAPTNDEMEATSTTRRMLPQQEIRMQAPNDDQRIAGSRMASNMDADIESVSKAPWELALASRIREAKLKTNNEINKAMVDVSLVPARTNRQRSSGRTSQENSNEISTSSDRSLRILDGGSSITPAPLPTTTGREEQFQELNLRGHFSRSPTRRVEEQEEEENDDETSSEEEGAYGTKRRRRPIVYEDDDREEYDDDDDFGYNSEEEPDEENHVNWRFRNPGGRSGRIAADGFRALPIRYISARDLPTFARFPRRYNTRMVPGVEKPEVKPVSQSATPTNRVSIRPASAVFGSPLQQPQPPPLPAGPPASTSSPLQWLQPFTLPPSLASLSSEMTQFFRLPSSTSSLFRLPSTTTQPPSPAVPQFSSPTVRSGVLYASADSCDRIAAYARSFQIRDVPAWVRNNCQFAKMYVPGATCQQINAFVDSCYEKMRNRLI